MHWFCTYLLNAIFAWGTQSWNSNIGKQAQRLSSKNKTNRKTTTNCLPVFWNVVTFKSCVTLIKCRKWLFPTVSPTICLLLIKILWAFQLALMVKNRPAVARDVRDPYSSLGWGRSLREGQPAPVFLPGESHGLRSLVGHSLKDHKESHTMEWLSTHTVLITKKGSQPKRYSFRRVLFLLFAEILDSTLFYEPY